MCVFPSHKWAAERGWTVQQLQRMSLRFTASPVMAKSTGRKDMGTGKELALWALILLDRMQALSLMSKCSWQIKTEHLITLTLTMTETVVQRQITLKRKIALKNLLWPKMTSHSVSFLAPNLDQPPQNPPPINCPRSLEVQIAALDAPKQSMQQRRWWEPGRWGPSCYSLCASKVWLKFKVTCCCPIRQTI